MALRHAAALCLPFLLGFAAPAAAASFDCARARSAEEMLICSTPSLDAADSAMGAGYKALLDRLATDEAGRGFARAEQRAWSQRRNRVCGFGRPAGAEAASGFDDPAVCLQAETERRTKQLAALRADPALGARLRTVSLTEGKPRARLYIRAERPEIADPATPGAVFFNETLSRFVEGELASFRKEATDLPEGMEAELILTADVHAVSPGVLSVQFLGEGVQGNGFRYAAGLTVDLGRHRLPTLVQMFGDRSWPKAATAACRTALGPDLSAECDGPDLRDARSWRFEPDRAVATLLLPGKELREIALPFRPPSR
ncbi:MAG: lysozyme inhibitor LprI family protein [Alphaproteobacteria bacterium]